MALIMFLIFEAYLTIANKKSNIGVNRTFIFFSFFFMYWQWNKKSYKAYYNYHMKVQMLGDLLMSNDLILNESGMTRSFRVLSETLNQDKSFI